MNEIKEIITARAVRMLKEGTDDYASQIWNLISEEVIKGVKECSGLSSGEGFTDGDIKLAIGRTLLSRLLDMTPNQYQEAAMKTCSLIDKEDNAVPMLTNAMLGLCGEAGECADLVKKHLYQSHGLDKAHMAKELGDVAWYLAEAAESIGYSLEDIFQINIDKLKARYPEGHFDKEHSLHRAEDDA